jgi:YVTN family beta-propeller protein
MILLLPACWAFSPQPGSESPPAEEEGQILIYIQPFSQEAERIDFTLNEIAAERDDGTLVPLILSMQEFVGKEMKRQRLVASGRLEAGGYRGVVLHITKASLKTGAGEAALLVPEQQMKKQSPFHIEKGKTQLICLKFDARDSLRRGFEFIPAFLSFIPERPVPGLSGYVTNTGSGTVMIFDKWRMEIDSIIDIGDGPAGMILDNLLRRAYVILPNDDTIVEINTETGEVFRRIKLQGGDRPQDLGLSTDGMTLVTVNNGSDSVSFIDRPSGIETGRVKVGQGPYSMVINRTGSGSGNKAYIFNRLSDSISVIDLTSRSLVTTVHTDSGPLYGDFNRKGDRLYVIYAGSPYLTTLDPYSFSVLRRIYLGPQAAAIKVDTNTDLIYIARKSANTVEVYNPTSLLPVDIIGVGNTIDFMTIDAESNRLLLLSSSHDLLMAVDINSRQVHSMIDVGKGPFRVRIVSER